MKIILYGICGGTIKKVSSRTGREYHVTYFTSLPEQRTVAVYGDFGLQQDYSPREYVIEGSADVINAVSLSGGNPKK